MRKINIENLFLQAKKNKLENLLKGVEELKSILENNSKKSFINPLKDTIIEKAKNEVFKKYGFNVYLTKNNDIYIYNNDDFVYCDLVKLLSSKRIENSEYYSGYRNYKKYDIDITITFKDKKIINNDIESVKEKIKSKITEIEMILRTFYDDLKALNEIYKNIIQLEKSFNNYNYDIRKIFDNKVYYINIDNAYNNINDDLNESYYLENDFQRKEEEIIQALKKSNYFTINYKYIYNIKIDFKNKILTIYFSDDLYIIFNYDKKEIIKDIFENLKYNDFDNLNNLDDDTFNYLEKKAKIKFIKLKNKDNIINSDKISFFNSDTCFISSSDLHGFYTPNLELNYYFKNEIYKFTCISFIDFRAYAVFKNEEDKIILL